MISNAAKSFNIFATSLSVLHNYFNSSNKIIFKSKYLAKFLDTLTKLFFSCKIKMEKETQMEISREHSGQYSIFIFKTFLSIILRYRKKTITESY